MGNKEASNLEPGDGPEEPRGATNEARALREEQSFGPYPDCTGVFGVTYDGSRVWLATGERLLGVHPESGELQACIEVEARAGTAFDGEFLYQLSSARVRKIDPRTHEILGTLELPPSDGYSGMAWAEGSLWVGEPGTGRIHRFDAVTGETLSVLEVKRFVTGVSWVGEDLWHCGVEGEQSSLYRISPETGETMEELTFPEPGMVSGISGTGEGTFFCGGGYGATLGAFQAPNRRPSDLE